MGLSANLMTKYPDKLAKEFDYASVISGKTSTDYKFDGAYRIQVISLVTQPLNDYNMNASSNRYGTPTEMEDVAQYIELDKDRSYSIPVDKRNLIEGNYLKTAGAVFEEQLNGVVAPEMDKDFFDTISSNAGVVLSSSTAITASNIISRLLAVEAAMRNARAPRSNRFAAVPTTILQLFRQSLTNCDEITDKLLLKGIVGKIGTLLILEVGDDDVPTGVNFVAWHKKAAVHAKVIDDVTVHKKPQGISGILNEGRFHWGSGVVGKYAKAVYTDCVNTSRQGNPTINSSTGAIGLNGAQYALYTLDGSDPRYSATAKKIESGTTPTFTAPCTIKAVGYYAGKIASAVVSQSFSL